MWKNYYKIAIRNLFNNKTFSAINIFGLAVGIACCLLMFLFIQNELSFDHFHSKKNNIYRIISSPQSAENSSGLAVTPAPWAPLMKKDYPEIKQYTRLLKDERGLVGEKGQPQLVVKNILFADSGLFEVFSFRLLKGNPSTALTAPNSIILTSELAKKVFGNTDPIGKLIEVNTSFTSAAEVLVTGVAADPPDNSHIKYGALISMSTLGDLSEHWSYHMYNTYVVLENGASRIALENKLKLFSQKYLANNPNADGGHNIFLQPLTEIHLHSHLIGELESNGDIIYVYIFSGIAFFVLCIASLNFMNLSTVRSLKRAKEVGMRKVIGAARSQLIKQFLTEAMLISFLALMIALILVVLGLPVFSQLSGRELGLKMSDHLPLFLMVFILTGLTGVLSGIYPAIVLSGFDPIDALKGSFLKGKTGTSLRKILVTFQFVICIVLMSGTMIVYKQLQFIKNKNLGFNKEKVMIAHIPQNTDTLKLQTLKNVLGRLPGVESVSAASTIPGPKIPVNLIHNGNSLTTKNSSMQMLFVDENFLRTMKMKLIAGRDFSKDFPGDPGEGFIINQEAVKQLELKNAQNALGKPFQWVLPDRVLKSGKIIGVVQDFNITPLRSPVQPLVLHIIPGRFQFLYMRISSNQALPAIEKTFKELNASQPFEYTFLDETIQTMYNSERRLGKMFGYFSGLAILIACLGILGLSIYYAQQRIKEIGIRKVLGASAASIVATLTGEFIKPVIIATLMAFPLAWWGMNQWLQEFAYRITINGGEFVLAGFFALIIAMVTVSFQAITAALANPVRSLRTE